MIFDDLIRAVQAGMLCPECKQENLINGNHEEGEYPFCEYCGHVELDDYQAGLRAEVGAEFERARRECWPDKVPSYGEYMVGKGKGEL